MLFAARSLQTKRPEILADNSLQNRREQQSSQGFEIILCATSVFSVSLWLWECEIQRPQRHREHRGGTEKYRQAWRCYDKHGETHDESDRSHYRYSDAQCSGIPTGDHRAAHRFDTYRLAMCAARSEP